MFVDSGPVVVIVTGGKDRTITQGDELALDVSRTYDSNKERNNQDKATLIFDWSWRSHSWMQLVVVVAISAIA